VKQKNEDFSVALNAGSCSKKQRFFCTTHT